MVGSVGSGRVGQVGRVGRVGSVRSRRVLGLSRSGLKSRLLHSTNIYLDLSLSESDGLRSAVYIS